MNSLRLFVVVVVAVLSGWVTVTLAGDLFQGGEVGPIMFIFGPALFLFVLGVILGMVLVWPRSTRSHRRSERRPLVDVGEPDPPQSVRPMPSYLNDHSNEPTPSYRRRRFNRQHPPVPSR